MWKTWEGQSSGFAWIELYLNRSAGHFLCDYSGGAEFQPVFKYTRYTGIAAF